MMQTSLLYAPQPAASRRSGKLYHWLGVVGNKLAPIIMTATERQINTIYFTKGYLNAY
jgi:hypothetical protein